MKAAFLYNFSKFVEWPPHAFGRADGPFIIGVLGKDPFGEALERAVAGKFIQGRPVVIRRWISSKDFIQCHLLFVSNSERDRLPDILNELKGSSVLTVAEMEGFVNRGGMINFLLLEGRVQFEINNRSAQSSRIRISSKLLQLARNVWE